MFPQNRKLEERETLAGKVRYLEMRLAEKDEEIKLLTRKNALESKNFKSQLANEQQKIKDISHKQEKAAGGDSGRKSAGNIVEVCN